jgi:hypothetical protein
MVPLNGEMEIVISDATNESVSEMIAKSPGAR